MLNNSGNDFVESLVQTFKDAIELFVKKNAQYGVNDPLANFRAGALLETGFDTYPAMYNEAKAYSRKHIGQVYGPKQNITTPKVDESLEDIMVYAAILLYLHRKYNEQIAEVEKEV